MSSKNSTNTRALGSTSTGDLITVSDPFVRRSFTSCFGSLVIVCLLTIYSCPLQAASPSPSKPSETHKQTSSREPGALLTVPGTQSRGNSFDTPSTEGGETLVSPHVTVAHDGKSTHENEDPLKPDAGNEAEFEVEDNVFGFSPGQLGKLLNPKSHAAFRALGGIKGLEVGLRTDRLTGLSLDETTLDGRISFEHAVNSAQGVNGQAKDTSPLVPTATHDVNTLAGLPKDAFADRIRVFKDNRLPVKKTKSLWQLMWIALMDKVLLLLSGAAVISLALGLYQTFGGTHKPGEPKLDWVEGVAIIVAIAIVVIVGGMNDYQKERQFVKLNKKVIFDLPCHMINFVLY